MKTKKIAEFKNSATKITVELNLEPFGKSYYVTETPLHKKAKWNETKKEFDCRSECMKYFLECINFWFR